jgi:hypothetical protein
MSTSRENRTSVFSTATTVAVAALAGSLSYFATRAYVRKREQKDRDIALKEEKSRRDLQAKKQQMRG